MNKVILMGRLTKDPETRYSQGADPIAITRYSLAVARRYKKDGESDTDFINIITFKKAAEFASKYFKKGQMVSIVGRLRTSIWEDDKGNKKWNTDVVAEEQYFAGGKKESNDSIPEGATAPEDMNPFLDKMNEELLNDEDLPF